MKNPDRLRTNPDQAADGALLEYTDSPVVREFFDLLEDGVELPKVFEADARGGIGDLCRPTTREVLALALGSNTAAHLFTTPPATWFGDEPELTPSGRVYSFPLASPLVGSVEWLSCANRDLMYNAILDDARRSLIRDMYALPAGAVGTIAGRPFRVPRAVDEGQIGGLEADFVEFDTSPNVGPSYEPERVAEAPTWLEADPSAVGDSSYDGYYPSRPDATPSSTKLEDVVYLDDLDEDEIDHAAEIGRAMPRSGDIPLATDTVRNHYLEAFESRRLDENGEPYRRPPTRADSPEALFGQGSILAGAMRERALQAGANPNNVRVEREGDRLTVFFDLPVLVPRRLEQTIRVNFDDSAEAPDSE